MYKDFDFNNKSIGSNIKLLELKLNENMDENNKLFKDTGKLILSNFFYSLNEGIKNKTNLLNEMQGSGFKEKLNFLSDELINIKYEIDNINNDNLIDSKILFNIALNYSDDYINELAILIKEVKDNQFIDCEECNSLMEYLEEHQSYFCSNEDCDNEIGF